MGSMRFIVSVGWVYRTVGMATTAWVLAACSSESQTPERTGSVTAPVVVLDPPATLEVGTPSTLTATCPGQTLPDQCGSWAGVELSATRDATATATATSDGHCLCQSIDFSIPSELPVASGKTGSESDKAFFSFRDAGGTLVECEYRGNFKAAHGKSAASGGDKYVYQRCTRSYQAGQSVRSDWFQLALGQHPSSPNVTVQLRFGEPDVVDGAVQEQVFYATDPRISGAALHVPRGSAPAFETFSLDVVSQVAPGTAIENGGASVTSVGHAIDVHSNSTDDFAFTPVPGACPRIELPYEPARLEALLGPGSESALNAAHLTSIAGLASGAPVLEDVGPITVNLANHTLSFCVEHLSIYLGLVGNNRALLEVAEIYDGGALLADLASDTLPALPRLVYGKTYSLSLRFNNNGNAQWNSPAIKLVAVQKVPLEASSTVVDGKTIKELPGGTWTSWTTRALPTAPVAVASTVTFTFDVTPPASPAPMNFCLRNGNVINNNYFGECFSWDLHGYTGGTGSAPPTVCVPTTEVCNDVDDDCDGLTDEEGGPVYVADADGDGYAEPGTDYATCGAAPSGYITSGSSRGSDCCDVDANVHPGQTAYFSEMTPWECGSWFDYDCSGGANTQYATQVGAYTCNVGFTEDVLCGTRGQFVSAECAADPDCCLDPARWPYEMLYCR